MIAKPPKSALIAIKLWSSRNEGTTAGRGQKMLWDIQNTNHCIEMKTFECSRSDLQRLHQTKPELYHKAHSARPSQHTWKGTRLRQYEKKPISPPIAAPQWGCCKWSCRWWTPNWVFSWWWCSSKSLPQGDNHPNPCAKNVLVMIYPNQRGWPHWLALSIIVPYEQLLFGQGMADIKVANWLFEFKNVGGRLSLSSGHHKELG